jgi:hypothetical protein
LEEESDALRDCDRRVDEHFRMLDLMEDEDAQTGYHKRNATSLQNDFVVEGEEHYWIHVAIDRFTGQVLDKQIEVVNE